MERARDRKEYVVEKLGAFGEGVARDDGKTVFIKGALPGERVIARVVLDKKNFSRAKLEAVLDKSPHRTTPPCPYAARCGGCGLQHLDYEAQLSLKAQTVSECLAKAGVIADVRAVVPSPKRFGYRNKLSFPIRGKCIGMYEENSHNVVDIDGCLLQRDWNGSLISAVRDFMRDHGLRGYEERSGRGDLRHIVAREKNGSICIVLVTAREIDISGLLAYIPFPDFALYRNVNGRKDNVILGDDYMCVGGRGHCPDFHPASFYQVNDEIERLLYDEAIAEADGETIIDAYCGAGNLTLALSARAKFVYGVEICPQAVEEANRRMTERGILNAEFVCGDCDSEFARIAERICGDVTVVFDPPRKGVDRGALSAVRRLAPRKIVYVSCNPATLARDLALLSDMYDPSPLKLFDMFPQTVHVETMIVLQRK